MASDRDILPSTVEPSHYSLSISRLPTGAPWHYDGNVVITLDIKQPVKEIVLNSNQLSLKSASIKTSVNKSDSTANASNITYQEESQRATLGFDDEIPASSKAYLSIDFQGTVNNLMAGFYRSKYKPVVEPSSSVPKDDENHYMFSTQFESCDARRTFPCFDEPNLKATFDVSIELPDDLVALSNMSVKSEEKASQSGFKVVTFDTTPVMSTYLLAWAVGDFEYVEAFTERKYDGKNLPVRVYTTRGLKEQGRFALEHAHKTVDYFSEIFGIDYPLPKADLLAVHEFSHGAMENWGLVTYRTTAVLFDPATSAQSYKNRVAYVVAHELAHQWFGNLVTMDWWSELWLNEGFATWVGWFAVDHLHPDWKVWPQFVAEGVTTAFQLDSLRSSHPIEVPVRDALEVDQIFDSISYLKGCSVIRMLSGHLGVEVFLKGVSNYLKQHAYGNATTSDLWSALSKASGQDVNTFMDPWIRKIGFPILTVAEEPGQIGVRQNRFLITGDVEAKDDETTWWIPLGLTTVGSQSAESKAIALTSKEETIRRVDEGHYKLNQDSMGFFRVNYPPAHLVKLGEARHQLTLEDKVGLIGDAAATAKSGDATTAGLLALVENFQDEDNYLVWQQILNSLDTVKSNFSEVGEVHDALKKFTLKLVSPAVEKVGWEFKEDEGYLTGQLRSLLISQGAAASHEGVIAEAQKRFSAYTSGDTKAIHPSLRLPIFRIIVRNGGQEGYEAIKKQYSTVTSIDGKEQCLSAMGRIQSPSLAQEYLSFLFSDKVAIQDVHTGGAALAANAATRHLLWAYVKSNWPMIRERLGGNMVVLERFLRISLTKFASFDVAKDIQAFFAEKDNRGYDRALGVIDQTIRASAGYKERDADVLGEWLKAHGYA